MTDRLLDIEQVSEILGTTKDRVYALHNAGLLKCMKLGRLKVREKTLEEFLERYDGCDLNDPNDIKEVKANA